MIHFFSAASVVKGTEIDERSTIPSPSSASAMVSSPPLELRRGSPHDRTQVPQDSSQVVPVYMHRSASSQQFYYESPHHAPPPAHRPHNPPAANAGRLQTPPHASQVNTLVNFQLYLILYWSKSTLSFLFISLLRGRVKCSKIAQITCRKWFNTKKLKSNVLLDF